MLPPESIDQCRIVPDLEIFYISSFVSETEQRSITSKVYSNDRKWIQLKHRRLQAWPSELVKGKVLIKCPLPSFLLGTFQSFFDALSIFDSTPHKSPNHVLVNEYLAGQGISPHEDGDAYHPLVATVSLGSHCIYNIYTKDTTRTVVARLLLEPGSCLITRGEVYSAYLHGIDGVEVDTNLGPETVGNWNMLQDTYRKAQLIRGTRISLTYRDVLKEKIILKHTSR